MRNRQQREDILREHYKTWMETTKNKYHREYAEIMYQAMLDGNYKKVYAELGKNKKALYDPKRDITYRTLSDAAQAYRVNIGTMSINYLRYGLRRVMI
jgi:hypothetical protein